MANYIVHRAKFQNNKSYIGITTQKFKTRISQHKCHQKQRNNK